VELQELFGETGTDLILLGRDNKGEKKRFVDLKRNEGVTWLSLIYIL
jgi:hypothetical protein